MLDPAELRAFQGFAAPLMTTPVEIYRSLIAGEGWSSPVPSDYDPAYDYGDDELTNPDAEDPGTYPVATTTAWFFSHIQQAVSMGAGQIGTIDIHEVRLPSGTDIAPMDLLKQLDTGEVYVVVDTNAEDTLPDMLRASLRRRE